MRDTYTEMDALYDIVIWQLPVPFILAVVFVWQTLAGPSGSFFPYWVILPMFLSACSFVVVVLLILDLLILPPIFVLIRLWHAEYFLH